MKKYLLMVLMILSVVSLHTYSNAEVYGLALNINAARGPLDSQWLELWLKVYDTETTNSPKVVDSIKMSAPDGTIVWMNNMNWNSAYQWYGATFSPENFISGQFFSGDYTVTVNDKSGNSISASDYVTVSPLDIPVILSPGEGSIFEATTPVTWSSVPGAKCYQISLWNETRNRPVYWWTLDNNHHIIKNEFTIPKKMLRKRALID